MTDDRSLLSHHPAPKGDELSPRMIAFLLYTGPLAWFAQLCIGMMLTSWPCFPGMERLGSPLKGYEWTRPAALLILLLCALLATVSGIVGFRKLQAVKEEREGGHHELIEVGHGRTRFVALWGTILGFSFTVATLVTLVAFTMVPRCAG